MPDSDLTMREVCARYGVKRWSIHRWIRDHNFPKGSKRLGQKGARWSVASLDAWDASLISIPDVSHFGNWPGKSTQ